MKYNYIHNSTTTDIMHIVLLSATFRYVYNLKTNRCLSNDGTFDKYEYNLRTYMYATLKSVQYFAQSLFYIKTIHL